MEEPDEVADTGEVGEAGDRVPGALAVRCAHTHPQLCCLRNQSSTSGPLPFVFRRLKAYLGGAQRGNAVDEELHRDGQRRLEVHVHVQHLIHLKLVLTRVRLSPLFDHHRLGAGTWAPFGLAILAVQALADARNVLCLKAEHVGDLIVVKALL